jgi:hypothetical protein
MGRSVRDKRKQQGAAMIEYALTVSLFLLLVLGIMEFTLLMMDMGRANEMTRQLSRIAITADPVCDIFDPGDCPGAVDELVCPGGSPIVVTLDDVDTTGCDFVSGPTGCRMMDLAETFLPGVAESQIQVTYSCSVMGFVGRPTPVPLVTVSLQNFTRPFLFAGFLGISSGITFPTFDVTRAGEDLYTERL